MGTNVFIHPTANVAASAKIGDNTKIWINAQVRENAAIGKNCIISKDTYIDFEVSMGDGCKLQNGVSVYHGVTLEDDVFVGPYAVFTERPGSPRLQCRPAGDTHAGNYRLPGTLGEIARIFRYFVVAGLFMLMCCFPSMRGNSSASSLRRSLRRCTRRSLAGCSYSAVGVVHVRPGVGHREQDVDHRHDKRSGCRDEYRPQHHLYPGSGDPRGSAFANLVSAAVVFTMYMAYSQKLYCVPHQWGKLGLSVALVAAVIVVGSFLPLTQRVSIGVKAVLIVGVAAAFLRIGIVEVAEVRQAMSLLSGRFGWVRR